MKLTRFTNDYPGLIPLDRLYAKLTDASADLYPSEAPVARQRATRLLLLSGALKARLLENDPADKDNHKVVFELVVPKGSPKIADALKTAKGYWPNVKKAYGKYQRKRAPVPSGTP